MALNISHKYKLTENNKTKEYTKAYVRIKNIMVLASVIENDGTDTKKEIHRINVDYYKDKVTRDTDAKNYFESQYYDSKVSIKTMANSYAELKKLDKYKNGKDV